MAMKLQRICQHGRQRLLWQPNRGWHGVLPLRQQRRPHSSGEEVPASGSREEEGVRNEGPSKAQLKAHFMQSMVPMVGFGFMDNTVMIHAGNAIDLTLGVTFGLSTMAAAACGQICSDVAGVSFGGVIEATARRLGLPSPKFSSEDIINPTVKRVGLAGNIIGVMMGCSLGLFNLLLIDTDRKELKLAAAFSDGGGASDFSVQITNEEREDMTVLRIDGPTTKGLLASVLHALVKTECVVHEIHADAGKSEMGEMKRRTLHIRKEGAQVEDDQLENVARAVLSAAKKPEKTIKVMLANDQLKQEVCDLKKKLEAAEEALTRSQISMAKRSAKRIPISMADMTD